MVFISQSAGRLFRAIFEIVLWRGWAALALVFIVLLFIDLKYYIICLESLKFLQNDKFSAMAVS
jgi:hypothetical protein